MQKCLIYERKNDIAQGLVEKIRFQAYFEFYLMELSRN